MLICSREHNQCALINFINLHSLMCSAMYGEPIYYHGLTGHPSNVKF
jgi:hypothetical protein